jgi:class 3 adenylate cyclase
MKRKIAAIMAADVAGYSRLVSEDEEETLRRLAAYREVFDDFVAKAGGRIFNTAGDAVLAEFSSAVEAVRCAIDVQESLRTRNLAYPSSRQMSFRIGITIGDVVEREGDLLGDGVNIAARLEGIAPIGGICVSRNVYEQVANKLSVQFADIGEQQIKNIPNPVHAFTVAMIGGDGEGAKVAPRTAQNRGVAMPLIFGFGSAVAAGVAVAAYLFMAPAVRLPDPVAPAPPASTVAAASAPVAPSGIAPSQMKLAAEKIPMVSDRDRASIRNNYMSAPGHKAIAISPRRATFLTGQPDEQSAKSGALASCQAATDAVTGPHFNCEVFAIGDTVVSARTHPPLPPEPWLVKNPAVERPIAAEDVPLINNNSRNGIAQRYMPGPTHKALALAPSGQIGFFINQASVAEAARRALEFCGLSAGIPCAILATDNAFAIGVPTSMKPTGFFQPAAEPAIALSEREDVARRLKDNTAGWNAVAVGIRGYAGLALKAGSEKESVAAALADCGARDRECRIIAIGMFSVAAR